MSAAARPQVSVPPHDELRHARRWWILAVIAVAQLMVILDATIVNIALPTAQKGLHFSDADRQWVVTAYTLAFGGLLLVGGRLGDLFGRKPTLVVGLVGFAGASAVGGAAQSFGALAGARAVQGAFAALLAPTALALLNTTFTDPRERNRAFGIWGAVAGSGAAVGLLLGGALTEYLSWRWCLYVNLVLALPTAAGALALLAHQPRPDRPRIDVLGTLAAVLGLFALVYGFNHAETHGWGAQATRVFLAAGIVLLTVFAVVEARATRPLVPARVVLDRNRGGSYLAVGIVGVGMFGAFFFLTYYLQGTRGYSPVETGVAFLPMIAAVMVTAQLSSQVLLPRMGPRLLVATGMLCAAAGCVVLAQLGVASTYAAHVLPSLILVGLGLGLVMAPAMNTGTLGVRAADSGVASAMVNTMQQVGGSLGTALLSTLAAGATTRYLAGKRPDPAVVAHATVHGYTVAFWWAAGIFAIGAVLCGLLLRSGAPTAEPDASLVLAA